MSFKRQLPQERAIVNVGWWHRIKLLWTGKIFIVAHRTNNTPSGIKIDGVAI